jgi:hypothetical protein
VSDNLDLVARCEKSVHAAAGEEVTAARLQPYYLDVTNAKANKGEVVAAARATAELIDPVKTTLQLKNRHCGGCTFE